MIARHSAPHRRQTPRWSWFAAVAMMLVLSGSHAADAQRTTEQFIPIGQSPGLSGVVTLVGEIVAVDPGAGSFTLRRPGDADTVTATVTNDTRIWLDRSSIGLASVTGGFGDLFVGGVAEIHFRDQEARRDAAWVKIQADDPG